MLCIVQIKISTKQNVLLLYGNLYYYVNFNNQTIVEIGIISLPRENLMTPDTFSEYDPTIDLKTTTV